MIETAEEELHIDIRKKMEKTPWPSASTASLIWNGSMTKEQVKKWKNYYKNKQSQKSDDIIITSLTTDARTNIQTSGFSTQNSI
ncbi:MAG: hypothetical protein PHW85_01015 [Bacteroidales bacterium]|jgi:hypothetical protein|nr:hypothetical protein [Bacteroidales bacterium]MDD4420160.1 hypothetical protein [Bacteroidales bacterium]